MEIIDLQANDQIKDKYKEVPNLKQFACKFISMFGTIYVCEQTFSRMMYLKSKYRANLSDDHLQSLIVIGETDFNPNYKEILQKKAQFHQPH